VCCVSLLNIAKAKQTVQDSAGSSNLFVSETVEQGFAPRLINNWVQLAVINGVLDLSVDHVTIDLTLIDQLVVFKAESGSFRYSFLVRIIANLEEDLFIASTLGEFSESNEIVRVNTVEGLDLRGKCAPVHDKSLNLYLSTELGLGLINGDQSNLSVLISPEAAPS
jgi:hypothetical protein